MIRIEFHYPISDVPPTFPEERVGRTPQGKLGLGTICYQGFPIQNAIFGMPNPFINSTIVQDINQFFTPGPATHHQP